MKTKAEIVMMMFAIKEVDDMLHYYDSKHHSLWPLQFVYYYDNVNDAINAINNYSPQEYADRFDDIPKHVVIQDIGRVFNLYNALTTLDKYGFIK